jgi:hypothetical protein
MPEARIEVSGQVFDPAQVGTSQQEVKAQIVDDLFGSSGALVRLPTAGIWRSEFPEADPSSPWKLDPAAAPDVASFSRRERMLSINLP